MIYKWPGKTNKVAVTIGGSEKFSEEEINDAVNCVKKKFKDFNGCTLTKLWYDEKKSNVEVQAYMYYGRGYNNGIKAENVIVLFSNFNTGPLCCGGFDQNSTYSDWNWTLIRDSKEGKWRVDDCGY